MLATLLLLFPLQAAASDQTVAPAEQALDHVPAYARNGTRFHEPTWKEQDSGLWGSLTFDTEGRRTRTERSTR